MGPPKYPYPNPQTCDYVTLHYKRDLALVITLWILKWRDEPRFSGWARCSHKGLYNRENGRVRFTEDVMTKAEAGVYEEETTSQGKQVASRS